MLGGDQALWVLGGGDQALWVLGMGVTRDCDQLGVGVTRPYDLLGGVDQAL